jgi:hypothetical protein
MSTLKRTSVYVDPTDLTILKEAAKDRGVSEAELMRDALHRAALRLRRWNEPLNAPSFHGGGKPATSEEIADAITERETR